MSSAMMRRPPETHSEHRPRFEYVEGLLALQSCALCVLATLERAEAREIPLAVLLTE
jgi:hypothetical protein